MDSVPTELLVANLAASPDSRPDGRSPYTAPTVVKSDRGLVAHLRAAVDRPARRLAPRRVPARGSHSRAREQTARLDCARCRGRVHGSGSTGTAPRLGSLP